MSREELTATAPDAPAGETARPEVVLGRYRIERQLGAGGMGVVYAALDLDLQRPVALKAIREGLSKEAEQRFLREAQVMAKLSHVNVVTVYDVESEKGRDYISMELIDGVSVDEWLRTEKRSEREILDVFVQAARGLAAAHDKGIVHRDFKPHNVLRSTDGRIAVGDFGLAREARGPLSISIPPEGEVAPSALTVAGGRVGTPAYMAPEQWRGERVTFATDQFAFCVALWEAFAGERPFRGATVEELKQDIERAAPAMSPAIPRRLRSVLVRGLERDPAKRWPSMTALGAQLVRRRRWPYVAAGLAVLAIAAIAVLVLRGGDNTAEWETLRKEAVIARYDGKLDVAVQRYRRMLELGVDDEGTAIELGKTLLGRKQPGDLVAARELFAKSNRPEVEWLDATAAWSLGEANARERLLRFHKAEIQGQLRWKGPWISGEVVLPDGKRAEGAAVAVGMVVMGDSDGIAVPLWDQVGITASVWVTEAFGGHYEIRQTPSDRGVIVAQLGNLRSRGHPSIDNQKLQLEPTTSLRGRVERGGRTESLFASAHLADSQVFISAPVQADGTFTLRGLIAGPTVVGISYSDSESPFSGFMVLQQVEVGATPIGPLQFELPATRAISVVVRGATRDDFRAASNLGVPVAFVYIGSGSFDAAGRGISALEQRPQLAAEATGALPEVLGIELLPGDQVARFRRAPIGDATVCVQVSGRNVEANLITRCQPVPPNAEVVVVKL